MNKEEELEKERLEKLDKQRAEQKRVEQQKVEQEKLERARLEKEKLENEIELLQKENNNFELAEERRLFAKKIAFYGLIPTTVAILVSFAIVFFETKSREKIANAGNCVEYLKLWEKEKNDIRPQMQLIMLTELSNCFNYFERERDELELRISEISAQKKIELQKSVDLNRKLEMNTVNVSDETRNELETTEPVETGGDEIPNNIMISDSIEGNEIKQLQRVEKQRPEDYELIVDSVLQEEIKLIVEGSEKAAKLQEKLEVSEIPTFSKQYWVKSGYYIDTGSEGDSLRILMKKLDKDVCTLVIYNVNSEDENKFGSLKRDFILSQKNPTFEVEHQNTRYRIVYSSIGKAGKNPFKKALYFTFQKYNLTN